MRSIFVILQSRPGRILRTLVSLALLSAFVLGIDWARLAATRGRFAAGTVAWATVLAGITYPLHAWRWWLLFRAHGSALSLNWAHSVTWISQFYNSFLIGGLGGDAARVYYLCRDEPERKAGGLAAIVLDRVMGLVVLMSLAVLALVAKAGVLALEPGLRWIFIVSVAVTLGGAAAGGLMLATDAARWPRWVQALLRPAGLGTVTQLLAGIRSAKGDHVLALVASYAIWLLDIVAIWLLARAVGLSLPFLETCIAVSVAYAATALPISVGGHGVREGALLAVLGMFGVLRGEATDQGLLLGILVWAATVLWSLAGGLVLLAAGRLLPPLRPAAGG
jgi:uncharacterized membrane protein YbhN (UPF0104 family)